MEQMANESESFEQFIDVEDDIFKNPVSMPDAIKEYCKKTGQKIPESIGRIIKCTYESLAFKYRYSVEELSKITGKELNTIHIVGGGAKDDFLCQATASATGKIVISGPVEGTAFGNIAVQLLAGNKIKSLKEARDVINKSIITKRYEEAEKSDWQAAYIRYKDIMGY